MRRKLHCKGKLTLAVYTGKIRKCMLVNVMVYTFYNYRELISSINEGLEIQGEVYGAADSTG